MSKQYNTMEEPPKKKRSLCSCLCCFLIWLFPVCLALGIALFFSPNERIKDIMLYNERASEWMSVGLDDFRNASFVVCVNDNCTDASFSEEASGDLYPTGDKCDKPEDPEGGCVETVPGYFTKELDVFSGDVFLKVLSDGMIVVNETIHIPNSKTYLKSICYRVRSGEKGYELDLPPTWELRAHPTEAGCEFGNSWEPIEYSKKPLNKISLQIRSYQDPYIAASSLTRGCNEDEKNHNCFGTTKKDMQTIGLYVIMAMGVVCAIELLILFSACCCCRQKIPCCDKEYDELN